MTPAVDMPDVCDCHGVPTLAETTARLALLDRERAAAQARHDEALRCAEGAWTRG